MKKRQSTSSSKQGLSAEPVIYVRSSSSSANVEDQVRRCREALQRLRGPQIGRSPKIVAGASSHTGRRKIFRALGSCEMLVVEDLTRFSRGSIAPLLGMVAAGKLKILIADNNIELGTKQA